MMPFNFGNVFGDPQLQQRQRQQQQAAAAAEQTRAGRVYRGDMDPRQWIAQEMQTRDAPQLTTANDLAERHREEGNVHFRAERYEEALQSYNTSLRHNSSNAQVYTNRSITFLKLKRPSEALQDAEKAIELNPKWHKAHMRRGQALMMLGLFSDALDAFRTALKYTTEDAAIHELNLLIAKTESKLITSQPKNNTNTHNNTSSNPATPIPSTHGSKTDLFSMGNNNCNTNPTWTGGSGNDSASSTPPPQLEPCELDSANRRRNLVTDVTSTMKSLKDFQRSHERTKRVRTDVLSSSLDLQLTHSFNALHTAQNELRTAAAKDDRKAYQEALEARDNAARSFQDLYGEVNKSLQCMEEQEDHIRSDTAFAHAVLQQERANTLLEDTKEMTPELLASASELHTAMSRTNQAYAEFTAALAEESRIAEKYNFEERSNRIIRSFHEMQQLVKQEDVKSLQEKADKRLDEIRSLRALLTPMHTYSTAFQDSQEETSRLLRDEANLEAQRLALEKRRIKLNAELEWKKVRGITETSKDKKEIDDVRQQIVQVVSQQSKVQERLAVLTDAYRPEIIWKAAQMSTEGGESSRSRVSKWIKGSGLWIDKSLADFDIVKVLNSTHESKVYQATHQGQMIALKEIYVGTEKSRKRFQHEISIISKLNHPNVIKIKGVFYDGPLAYIIMPYY
eukprot:PhF_6_TR31478/c0_g1_i1/m.46264